MFERIHQDVAARIKELRMSEDKGWAVEELASRAGVGRGRVYEVEDCEHGPDGWSIALLCKLANALGVKLVVSLK